MPDYDNTNRWVLFRNEDRRTDKSPEYSGTLNVDGREFYLSAWVKEGKKGKFFSGSLKPKDAPKKIGTVSKDGWTDIDGDPVPF